LLKTKIKNGNKKILYRQNAKIIGKILKMMLFVSNYLLKERARNLPLNE
jgi:hypothetical protein